MVDAYIVIVISLIGFVRCDDIYMVDHLQGTGRQFEGIGGLSGGGATSKLLVNYPQKQRNEILDYLFKPGYGASLNILKVEIGGDAQSTDGTEASHMHYSWDENYQRGYEWWLMLEAKKRNPDILLYCLPWAFPAWVGDGTRNPYHNINKTADYVIKFISGAWKYYKLRMNYVGIWNERNYDASYIKHVTYEQQRTEQKHKTYIHVDLFLYGLRNMAALGDHFSIVCPSFRANIELLRKKLNEANFTDVLIVASDALWEPISENILNDKDLADAVHAIGVHYPGTKTVANAVQTGKALWSSEDYSTFNDNVGAGCWARILNQNYVVGNMTSTISWNLIASYYEALPFDRNGLMTAVSPWSGNYRVESPIWMTAHTTWFVWPGWFYSVHGNGVYLLKNGGSLVSFVSPDSTQLTLVIETMSHDHSKCIRPALPPYDVTPQNISLQLTGYFAQLFALEVWYSKLGFDGNPSTLMKKLTNLPVIKGKVYLSLGVDEVYTLTTIKRDLRGADPPVPDSKPFPLPYTDTFESYAIYKEPYNFSPQVGTFEVLSTADPQHKQVLRQMVIENPIFWCLFIDLVFPIGVLGDFSWTDIYAEVETRVGTVNETSGVFVAARVNKGGCSSFEAEGIYFFLFPKDGYIEVTGDLAQTQQILKQEVSVTADGWNKLGLLLKDGQASGMLNNQQVFSISLPDKTPKNGFVALGTSEYGLADFDNLKISTSSEGENVFKELKNKHGVFNYKDVGVLDAKEKFKDHDTLYFKPHKRP